MSDTDATALRQLANDYYEGMARGRGELLARVFEPGARFQGVRDGVQVRRGLDEFVTMVSGANADLAFAADYSVAVELMDITGPVAVLKVRDRFRGRTYVDYLTAVKDGGDWKIVNKAFTTVD